MTSDGIFTGLVLVSGVSSPAIQPKIMDTLAAFTIKILDQQSMDIRDRYFLTILFSLDKAHADAIEKDLLQSAESLGVDLAIDYQIYQPK